MLYFGIEKNTLNIAFFNHFQRKIKIKFPTGIIFIFHSYFYSTTKHDIIQLQSQIIKLNH